MAPSRSWISASRRPWKRASAAQRLRGAHRAPANGLTMTSPVRLRAGSSQAGFTELGVILGTAAYMAPEQARGKAVDRRADVWAFGCVLYEMLTGKRAFRGDDITDVLAAIVRDEPDWSALPPSTPASIHRLLRRSLIKDKNDRLGDIGVARLEITDAANPSAVDARVGSVPASSRVTRFGWMGAAAVAGALVTGLAIWQLRPASPVLEERRASILIPDARRWIGPSGSGVVISPNGARIAYTAVEGSDEQLFVQSLAEDAARLVPNSQDAYGPFFSPDSSQLGFISRGKLWRMPIGGSSTFEVGDINSQDGAAWAEDGFIYSGGLRGLSRISQSGGARESLTNVDASRGEVAHRFPAVIPGQNAIVFTIFKGAIDDARLAVLDIASRKITPLTDLPGHDPRVTPDGYLIYSRGGTLMAASFDLGRRVLTSTPEPVLGGVAFNNGGATHYGVSGNGTLIYVSEADEVPPVVLVWSTRDGRTEASTLPEGRYEGGALSPDGTRVAVSSKTAAGSTEISVWDFGRNAWVAKLAGKGYRESPVWMPDGRRLLFTHRVEGIGSVGRLFIQALEGGSPEAISDDVLTSTSGSTGQFPGSVTADGAKVFFTQNAGEDRGIAVLDLATRKSTLIVRGGGVGFPRVSPNGQFLAYVGGGQSADVYVSRLPIVEGQRWTVSAGGGHGPVWSADGRELFYQSDRKIFSVAVTSDFSARPRLVFESTRDLGGIGVHPDGRFLLGQATRDPHPTPRVVFNWIGTLARVRKAGR